MNCYQREWCDRLQAINWLPPFTTWSQEDKENASKLSKLKVKCNHDRQIREVLSFVRETRIIYFPLGRDVNKGAHSDQ